MKSNFLLETVAASYWNDSYFIAGFVIGILLLAAFTTALVLIVKRKIAWFIVGLLDVLVVVAMATPIPYMFEICLALLTIVSFVFLFANMSEYRYLVTNGLFKREKIRFFKKRKIPNETLFDREAVYDQIEAAVIWMSKLKMGALITIMKKDDLLSDSKLGGVIKQRGADVNAPVTKELLETIFYPGTQLHDGAVIIKDDKIARASVFFASTTRPLTGKFGSRHQAALGISENSDAVTVLVSEETGRISIAFQGELTTVTPDTFRRVLDDDMAYVEDKDAI